MVRRPCTLPDDTWENAEDRYLESRLGSVPLESALMVMSTFTPGFRATGFPFSSFSVFSTRISR
jgi:hypothetical protein